MIKLIEDLDLSDIDDNNVKYIKIVSKILLVATKISTLSNRRGVGNYVFMSDKHNIIEDKIFNINQVINNDLNDTIVIKRIDDNQEDISIEINIKYNK